jgi:predicted DCC family thiol-disulfide oxidoreductase YuxK
MLPWPALWTRLLASDSPINWLLYDGECPFCSRYVVHVRLREAVGQVMLANAREYPALVEEVRRHGYDVDTGMVLKLNGRYYHGADCIHALALLTTPAGWFNRINSLAFRSHTFARIAYPILRTGRNITLRLLGRSRLDASAASTDL